VRNEIAYPGLDGVVAGAGVIGLASFVIGSSDDQVVDCSRTGVETHIVIGIEGVPIEPVRK